MTQAMVLVGILAICALSGVLLTGRPRWASGPEEPTGRRLTPTPPVPTPPQAATVPGRPPAAVTPSLPPATAAVPVQPIAAAVPPAPARPAATPARRGRNNGSHRFAPAAPDAVGRITRGAHR
jgi:hypothetical protein